MAAAHQPNQKTASLLLPLMLSQVSSSHLISPISRLDTSGLISRDCRQPRTAPAVGNPPSSPRAGPPTAETASSARSQTGSPKRSNPLAPLPRLWAEYSRTKLPHSQPHLPQPPVRPRNRGSSSRAVAVRLQLPSSTSCTNPSLLPPQATTREGTATRNSCPLTDARSSLSTRAPPDPVTPAYVTAPPLS